MIAILAVLSLVALFVQVWGPLSDGVDSRSQEKNGLEYLVALNKATVALTNAESVAVDGGAVERDTLSSTADAVSAVDNRYGDDLGARDRWAAIRAKIEALPDRNLADPNAAYKAYSEVTDLVLALYTRVRIKSGLDHDANPVAFYLQDGGTEELPQIIVRSGRYDDLAAIASKLKAPTEADGAQAKAASTAQASAAATLSAYRAEISEGVSDLNNDLQSAVDVSPNGTLGTNLLRQLDGFQRAADVLAPPPSSLTDGALPNAVEVGKQRDETQAAAIELTGTMLGVLTTTVDDQIDKAGNDRTRASVFFALALLLLLVAFLVGRIGRRRRPVSRGVAGEQSPAPVSGLPTQAPPLAGHPVGSQPGQGGPVGFGPGFGDPSARPDPLTGQVPSREWSGAPR